MALFGRKKRRNLFGKLSDSRLIQGPPLKSFLGNKSTANKLNQPYGQLQKNKNLEYWYSGDSVYLTTKRGSTLIKDITNKVYGAALYKYDRSSEYFIWIDGSSIKRCDTDGSNLTTITTALTTSLQTRWYMYGQDTNSSLYGCNGTDYVFKISGSTPTYSAVADSPNIIDITYDSKSGRLFGIYGHDIYYSGQQLAGTGVSDLETWKTDGVFNRLVTQPDDGTGFKRILDLGDATFAWKDTGVWAIHNTNEAIENWRRPKCKSDVGTLSPKTVQRVKYAGLGGAIFLGSDKTLRFFKPVVQDNAGQLPTVLESNAINIGVNFQTLLDAIPDAYIDKCTAKYHNEQYILNIPSASATEVDTTIIVDCDKMIPQQASDDFPQPFWYESVNMDYTDFVVRPNANKLYGFNKNGYIAQLFINAQYWEEMPTRITPNELYEDSGSTRKVAIEYSGFMGWHDFSTDLGGGHELELVNGYVHWEANGQWAMNFVLNAFKRGEAIPAYDTGLESSLLPNTSVGGYFDISLFDVATFAGDVGSISQNVNVTNKGHYFLFGFYSNAFNEPATIFGVDPNFKKRRYDPVGLR